LEKDDDNIHAGPFLHAKPGRLVTFSNLDDHNIVAQIQQSPLRGSPAEIENGEHSGNVQGRPGENHAEEEHEEEKQMANEDVNNDALIIGEEDVGRIDTHEAGDRRYKVRGRVPSFFEVPRFGGGISFFPRYAPKYSPVSSKTSLDPSDSLATPINQGSLLSKPSLSLGSHNRPPVRAGHTPQQMQQPGIPSFGNIHDVRRRTGRDRKKKMNLHAMPVEDPSLQMFFPPPELPEHPAEQVPSFFLGQNRVFTGRRQARRKEKKFERKKQLKRTTTPTKEGFARFLAPEQNHENPEEITKVTNQDDAKIGSFAENLSPAKLATPWQGPIHKGASEFLTPEKGLLLESFPAQQQQQGPPRGKSEGTEESKGCENEEGKPRKSEFLTCVMGILKHYKNDNDDSSTSQNGPRSALLKNQKTLLHPQQSPEKRKRRGSNLVAKTKKNQFSTPQSAKRQRGTSPVLNKEEEKQGTRYRKHILTEQKNMKFSKKYLINIFQSPSY